MAYIQRFSNSIRLVEWNHAKDHLNRRKHGVSFELAQRVFQDPNALMVHDRVDYSSGEDRWKSVGRAAPQLVLLVAYVLRREHPIEVVRILSARRASRYERQPYEKRVFDARATIAFEHTSPRAALAKSGNRRPLTHVSRASGRRKVTRSASRRLYLSHRKRAPIKQNKAGGAIDDRFPCPGEATEA